MQSELGNDSISECVKAAKIPSLISIISVVLCSVHISNISTCFVRRCQKSGQRVIFLFPSEFSPGSNAEGAKNWELESLVRSVFKTSPTNFAFDSRILPWYKPLRCGEPYTLNSNDNRFRPYFAKGSPI